MSEVKQQVIDEIIEGIESLMDIIDDLDTLQDFAERMDDARNGEIGDPVELMEILTDLLEYIADKIPNDNVKRLVQQLLKIAIGALEAGASLARWILLFRYRRRRAAGETPEDAAKHVTNDKPAQIWLRLKERQDKKGEEDENVEEDDGKPIKDAIPDLTFPRIPKPRWPKDHCCAKDNHDKLAPELKGKKSSSTSPLPSHGAGVDQHKVDVEFETSHPCGIKKVMIRAFTRSRVTSDSAGANPPWIELQKNTSNFSYKFDSNGSAKEKNGGIEIISSGEAAILYHVISNCGTSKSGTVKIINPV